MARWRVVDFMLVALLVLLVGAAARPASDIKRRQSAPAHFFESMASDKVRQSPSPRLTHRRSSLAQDGSPDATIADHGGFSVASIIGVAVSATFTIAVIISLSYSAYYQHAKLQLHKQFLERLAPHAPRTEDQQAGVSPEDVIADISRRTRTAADAYGLAVLMSSSAQLSPAIYSALQEEESSSPIAPAEAKAKAVMDDKVLGRREDILPLGHQFSQAAVDGQAFLMSRPAL